MIQNEVFDQLYNRLAGRDSDRAAQTRKRMNRARLALAARNYFFGVDFLNVSGAFSVTGTDQTEPVELPIVIRGAGMNAQSSSPVIAGPVDPPVGLVNIQLQRSGSSQAQISRAALRSAHYVSDGQGQPWSLNWPQPWILLPNELIQARFTQITPTPANTRYAVNFYGVSVDPEYKCAPEVLDQLQRQIDCSEQRPFYFNLKSEDGGGAIRFAAIGANQVEGILSEEVDQYVLVLGFRRNDSSYLPADTTLRISDSLRSFSQQELVIKGFEFFNAPDVGYFRFIVPHLLRVGRSLTAHLTTTTTTARNQMEAEINLVCVSV